MRYNIEGVGYKIIGEGEPVLFIHGGPGMTSKYFEYFVDVFSKFGYQCFLVDQRGNGMSADFDLNTITFEQLFRDFEKIRRHHGLDKINIVCHSFGGYIGLRYLIENSDSIDKAVIISSISITHEILEMTNASRSKLLQEEKIDIKEVPDNIPLSYYKFFRMCYPDKTLFNKRFSDLFDVAMDIDLVDKIGEILYPQYLDSLPLELENVQNSVLILHGDNDFIPSISSECIANKLENSQYTLIEGAGHFPMDEDREVISRMINDFLRNN